MGLLIEGRWADQWYDTKSTGGRFVRQDSAFRNTVTADGSSGFKAEPGRYHLYVCYACPWAHRTLIVRALKGLEDVISVDVVDPFMGAQGWTFADIRTGVRSPGATGDRVNGKAALHEVLLRWLERLDTDAHAWFVVQKHLGSDSLATWLTDQGWPATRRVSRSGYRVLEVARA